MLPIIIGSAGMIRMETQHHFQALGISAAASLALMRKHHVIAIDYLLNILRVKSARMAAPEGPPQQRATALRQRNRAANTWQPTVLPAKRPAPASPLPLPSMRTRSRTRADSTPPHGDSASAPCPDTPPSATPTWDRLVFTIGKTSGSMRREARSTG